MFRLKPFMNLLLDESQGALAHTKPIHVLLANLRELISTTQLKIVPPFLIYSTDFSQAFPSLNINYLLEVLKRLNLPDNILILLSNAFQVRTIRLQVNKRLLTEFNMERGVHQGDPLSSYLFNLGLMPLI